MAIQITQGTQTNVFTKVVTGGTEVQVVKLDIGSGTNLADFGGTITEVGNLVKGTITKLEGGTLGNLSAGTLTALTNGTIGAGTIQPYGLRHADAFSTVISSGTSTLGTIKAAVSGSAIYLTDLIISTGTITNVEIASGGTSTPIIGTLHLSTNGGAVINFNTPVSTASGSALVFKQSVSGPLTITALGYVD